MEILEASCVLRTVALQSVAFTAGTVKSFFAAKSVLRGARRRIDRSGRVAATKWRRAYPSAASPQTERCLPKKGTVPFYREIIEGKWFTIFCQSPEFASLSRELKQVTAK